MHGGLAPSEHETDRGKLAWAHGYAAALLLPVLGADRHRMRSGFDAYDLG